MMTTSKPRRGKRMANPIESRCACWPRGHGLAAVVALAAIASGQTMAASDAVVLAPTVTVTGILPDELERVPGSTYSVSDTDLRAQRPFTVREALRQSPGIHVVDEDAFGLNLNIGMRGLNPRRSQRMMLLEDGMPIHLAPYADPSSHYHPPLERVGRVDLLRGSGQIVHGPQTVGGVIDFVSAPLQRRTNAAFAAAAGNRDFRSAHGQLGTGGDWGGIALDLLRKQGDGTRDGHKHRVEDASVRGVFDLAEDHSLYFKFGHYRTRSNISEAGITQARYRADPLSNPFDDDRFELDRDAAQLVHRWAPNNDVSVSTNVYYQKTSRASYRQIDDSTDSMTANPDTGCVGDARRDYEGFASLCGNKMRPRNYRFFGIEPRLDVRFDAFGLPSEAVVGVRYHTEEVTRRRFNGLTPTARERSPGTAFRDWNEIEVDAWSAFVQNTVFVGDWTLTPGVRVERIEARNRARRKNFADVDITLKDRNTVVLPGFGVTWYGLPGTTVFAGVHRGFAPPRPDDNLDPTDPDLDPVRPERSTNFELGIRSHVRDGLFVEASLFRIDFRKQILPGAAVGRPELTYANAGRSRHDGIELGARVDFGPLSGSAHNVYLSGAYTHLMTARFDSTRLSNGQNVRGNRLPYAPRHVVNLALGYEHPAGWDARLGLEHVSSQYADDLNTRKPSANGRLGLIGSQTTVNAAFNYRLENQGTTLFLSGSNLLDRKHVVSRVDGITVSRPRQVIAGLRIEY